MVKKSHEKMFNIANFLEKCKSKLQYHLIPVRMAIIKKSTNNKCWKRCGEMGTLLRCWWECILVKSLQKTLWRFLKILKIELLNDPAIPFLGIYLEKTKIKKKYTHQCSLQCYLQ